MNWSRPIEWIHPCFHRNNVFRSSQTTCISLMFLYGGRSHDETNSHLLFRFPKKKNQIFPLYRYNGFLPQGDRGRRRSKFVLYKRTESNGVERSKHYVVQSPQNSKAILDANQHSISYTLSRNQAIIVEYKEDSNTDMFQVNIYFIHNLLFII